MIRLTRAGFAQPGTSLDFKTGSWRIQKPVHARRPAPCHAACPAGEDAQDWLARLDEGHPQAAWEALVCVNPLPAITGRVCHHPCESACNRGQYDEAVAIHGVERWLGDAAVRAGWAYPVAPPGADALSVAVVGAGPSGLAAAYHLLRLGYRPVLFEALPQAGGTCRTAIPGYRLPAPVLDAEVERLLATGIDFRPQQKLGRDFSLEELRHDYHAVYLAPGTQKSRPWSIDGVVPRDLHVALDLLKNWIAVGKVPEMVSAAIVGGGNTAVDVARVLRRSGVREVHIVSHEALPGPDVAAEDAMRAIPREIAQAVEEGVIIHPQRSIRRLILRGERAVGVELVHAKKLARSDGTFTLKTFEGTESVLHVDQVIPAIGQVVDGEGMEALLRGREFLEVDATGAVAGHMGVFAGGDARPGLGTVSGAIGDGRRAAQAIDRYLRGLVPEPEAAVEPIPFTALNLSYYAPQARVAERILPASERGSCEEIEGGLTDTEAKREARRCFSCGTCLACDNCWTLCPDNAVLKTTERARDGSHYVFDYDYCKGCGLCAHECPCGYIRMVEDL